MSWWDKASTAERLAQIDGGIACGMTARQIAIASRATLSSIYNYASVHGRHFTSFNQGGGSSKARANHLTKDRAAYLRGDRIDLWGTADHRDEFALDEREEA